MFQNQSKKVKRKSVEILQLGKHFKVVAYFELKCLASVAHFKLLGNSYLVVDSKMSKNQAVSNSFKKCN